MTAAHPPPNAADTRERIIDAASRVLRRRGYAGAGIDAMAAEAGLTSGAIYGHFRGKRALLTAVVEASVQANESVREHGLDALQGAPWVRALLRRYLSPEHHAAVEAGCPIPALVSELGRAGEEPQRAFAQTLEQLLERMETRWRTDDDDDADANDGNSDEMDDASRRQRVLAALAMAVGGMSLARAVGDDPLGRELLAACRSHGVSALIDSDDDT